MSEPSLIVNLTRGGAVCERAIIADRFHTRLRGLLGRRELPAGEGLLLRPSPGIHTAFMRFPIDALFLDSDLTIVRIAERLSPWRTASSRQARAVLELAAGEASRRGIQVGDRLAVLEATDDSVAWTGAGAEDAGADLLGNVESLSARRRGVAQPGRPMSVLLTSPDRRFRAVTALLLARRGVAVDTDDGGRPLAETLARHPTEVVVIDATQSLTAAAQGAAAAETMTPPVGVVVVADQAHVRLPHLPILAKWGSFDAFIEAVEEAHRDRGYRRSIVEQR